MRSNQLKLLLVSMLAVFAVGAVASSSASAHEFLIEGAPVAATTKVTDTSGVSKLEGVALVTIECNKDTSTGTIEPEGDSTANVKFTECKVVGAATCKVTEPVEFNVIDELTIFKQAAGELFEPASGFTFVEITVTGCSLEGKYKAKGKQQCELPEGEVEKVEHNVVCKPEGSELKLNTAVANFTSTETVKLESGKKWRVKI
jgi:hypothetical protein